MVKIFIWRIDLKNNPYLIEAGYWRTVISGEVENWVGNGTMTEWVKINTRVLWYVWHGGGELGVNSLLRDLE